MSKLPVIVCLCLCLSHASHACGKERWAVKTLADADSAVIDWTPMASSIDQLIMYKAPKSVLKLTLRVQPVETRVWRVTGLLIGYKLETDGDYHLVIAEPANPKITMIAEVPDPACMPEAYRAQVTWARQWIDSEFGKPGEYKVLARTTPITLTGVGFFDVIHGEHKGAHGEEEKGQTGVAKNGVELHPVLSVDAPVLVNGQ